MAGLATALARACLNAPQLIALSFQKGRQSFGAYQMGGSHRDQRARGLFQQGDERSTPATVTAGQQRFAQSWIGKKAFAGRLFDCGRTSRQPSTLKPLWIPAHPLALAHHRGKHGALAVFRQAVKNRQLSAQAFKLAYWAAGKIFDQRAVDAIGRIACRIHLSEGNRCGPCLATVKV
jgi:hypothetical protein